MFKLLAFALYLFKSDFIAESFTSFTINIQNRNKNETSVTLLFYLQNSDIFLLGWKLNFFQVLRERNCECELEWERERDRQTERDCVVNESERENVSEWERNGKKLL